MNDPLKDGPSKCPFHKMFSRNCPPDPGLYRPKSKREGVSPLKYVWWNSFYAVMEYFNRKLARDPNRKVSWDKWPPAIGLLYLIAKLRFNRSNALTDPYDYATNDGKRFGKEVQDAARHSITADGAGVSDAENLQMGMPGTRFGSNTPPRKVRPDVEQMRPSAREVGKIRWRAIDPETGREITIPALILNDKAGWWIQFQVHNFSGNTKRDPISKCPMHLARDPSENWPGNEALVDRTTRDPTRVTDNGRVTVINERVHAWIQAEIYGTNEEELARLRLFRDGYMRLQLDGHLFEDPAKPGIDLTGFNNNYSPGLSYLHWLFTSEHNQIADHYRFFHPDWDEERLFQKARQVNCAQMARIHTIQWTEDLLQHPTLQLAMHADWYGLLGQRKKMYLMRLCHRNRFVNWLLTPLRNNDILWGAAGSKWLHDDGPFQVPTQFRMVYRLHEMVLSEHEILDPATGATLDRIKLLDFVMHNTRDVVKRFGYEALAYSFSKKSCGALVAHNVARALTQFPNQQDKTLTDIAERDTLRERTDGTGTFNEFRLSIGEPPVTSFMELTGGDVELARELSIKFEGDVNKVDAGIGIVVEPKPEGFALGFCQFYQFVLNAPRRVRSNRHLSEGYTYAEYEEGMDWVEHGGGMFGVEARQLPGLVRHMEGVTRNFAPWPDTETFPLRMHTKTMEDTGKCFKSDLRTLVIGGIAVAASVYVGAMAPWLALLLAGVTALGTIAQVTVRMLAMRFMQICWKKCYTDKRAFYFGTLYKGDKWIDRSAHYGKLGARGVMAGGALLALCLAWMHPLIALLFAAVAINGYGTHRLAGIFALDAQVLKVSLRNRMREGSPRTDARDLPGETALVKRYWFLKGKNKTPIATISSMYGALRASGEPITQALTTAIMSAVGFARKTQKGMSWEQKISAGIGMFSWLTIYLPNLHQAESFSATRIYARAGNAKGYKPGDIDMYEFEWMFRKGAPGRDYLTAYDFARLREINRLRDKAQGKGSHIKREAGEMAARRRAEQLLALFADRVVEEDRALVPAISKDEMLRFYQGAAQLDLMAEVTRGDCDPSEEVAS